MKKILLFFFYFLLFVFLFLCRTSIITKNDLKKWNESLQNSEYITLLDIYHFEYNHEDKQLKKLSEKILIKKNTRVKIQIESQEDWIRLRILDSSKNPKENFGDVVLYVVAEENYKFSFEEIQKIFEKFISQHLQKLN
ncbi:MAG: hypothetical protein ACK4UJ_01350 [Leptonema sp. (in: bacteria)]